MIETTIRIQSLEDAANGDPLIEGAKKVTEAEHLTVCILEGGMESGRTSLSFTLKEGSEYHVAQMSLRQFEALSFAVQGAKSRFGGK